MTLRASHNIRRAVVYSVTAGVLLWTLVIPAWADDVDVQIKGIKNPLKNNASKSLSLTGKHKQPWSPAQIQRLYRLADKQIRTALQPYGYYNPKINQHLVPPKGKHKTWRATFNVDHGPATTITQVNLAAHGPGAQINGIQDALGHTQLARGKRLVQSDYSDTKSALYNAAYQAGYLDAKFSQSAIRVNPKANTAVIDLVLNTGPRYYFGPVTFDQDLLNDKFVHRFVPFAIGQPFNDEALIQLQLALSNSDYYSQIGISAPRGKATRAAALNQWFYDLIYPPEDPLEAIGKLEIPVTVHAQPSKPQHYTISAGYGTDTGPRLGLGIKFRHINQYGHQFSVNARISQIQRTLRASYDIPIGNVASDKLSFTAIISNEQYGDVTTTKYGIGAVRDTGWKLGRKRAYISLQREYYDIGRGNQHSTLLFPGYTFTLQKADSLLFTHKGVSLSLDARGGSSSLLSSTNFFRADFSTHVVLPVVSKVRLVLRGELGAIATDDFEDLPPSQRFFAGGARSVRGYSYQSISPTNRNNKDIGGRYKAVASAETDYFFYKKFGVAAFYDAGDVVDQTQRFAVKKGAGIGFRWGSPVGMVRLDVAHPFDDPGSSYRIHFSLGPDL